MDPVLGSTWNYWQYVESLSVAELMATCVRFPGFQRSIVLCGSSGGEDLAFFSACVNKSISDIKSLRCCTVSSLLKE